MLEMIGVYFFPCLINILTSLYITASFLNRKIEVNKLKFYTITLFLTIIAILNFIYVENSFRLLIITLAIFGGNYVLFKDNVKITIIATISEQLIAIISELAIMLLAMIFFKADSNIIINSYYGNLYVNLSICLMMILISELNITHKLYSLFVKSTTKINYNTLIVSILLLFIAINVLIFSIYSNANIVYLFIVNLFFLCIYGIIFLAFISEKNINVKYKQEKEILLNNLNEYEKMLDYQRVNNHENKNQLLVIKSMVEKKDKKTLEYINEIIKDKREDNDILYTKAKRIPSGGLQGLIYQKMLYAEDKNIKFNLDISTAVRKLTLFETDAKLNYDICRIIGIILDNAIEETIKLPKDEREVLISMYVDGCFNIEISNHFVNDVDINKIFNKGYTTKAEGHGYGLTLLKQIVDSNDDVINEVKVINGLFVQIIKIKM